MIDWKHRYEQAIRIAKSLMDERELICAQLREVHGLYLQPDGSIKTEDEVRRLTAPSH